MLHVWLPFPVCTNTLLFVMLLDEYLLLISRPSATRVMDGVARKGGLMFEFLGF